MRIKNLIATLILPGLLLAGLIGGKLVEKTHFSEVKATDANATLVGVYSAGTFNNTEFGGGYNNVLITYTGTAHGLTDDPLKSADILNKININGTTLTESGWGVIPWAGQLWFKIVYPSTVVSGDVLEIESGLTLGSAAFGNSLHLKLNENSKWEVFVPEVAPNSTYSHIYNDSFNNTEKFDGYKQVLIVYDGVAHGLTGDITSQEVLNQISINGTPLTALAVTAWEGQTWFNIIYPAPVYEGDILEVQNGFTLGNMVIEGFKLKLNSNLKWEKPELVEDDLLVRNNDYLLLTPSEVGAESNSSWAFYTPNPVNEMANLNFGIQFKINMTNEQLGGYEVFKLGSTFAGEEFLQLVINFKVNTYIAKFKNAEPNPLIGLTSISVTANVYHLFEFYCLKVSESTVCFILGIDGFIIFKTSPQDVTGAPACLYFGMLNGGAAVTSGVSSLTTTTSTALERFSNKALLMDSIPTSNVSETDACKGENGYYANAKTYYNNYLVQSQRIAFATDANYAEERARMIAWGAANGENISFNSSTGELVANSNFNILSATLTKETGVSVIIICALVSLSSIVMFVMLKKKKTN